MTKNVLRIGLVSGDSALKNVVLDAVEGAKRPVRIDFQIPRPAASLEVEELERIRSAEPQIVLLDLSEDPQGAMRVVGALGAKCPRTALVGVGPELDATLLMEAMRAGVVEYLPRPVEAKAIYEALGRVLQKRGWTGSSTPEEVHQGQILAFFSAKGGAGATTVATNVGIELHRRTDKKTLLVDLDLEMGEIASLLGVQPRFHLVDLVRNFHRMDADLLASYIESHDSGVHVLSAPFEPEIGEEVTGEQIGGILAFLRSHYDFVVVDTSKSLAPPVLTTLKAADRIFLVTNVDVPSIRNLKRALPALDGVTGGDIDRLRLVVNRYNPKGLVGLKDLEETLGLEAYATLGNDYKTVIQAISTGRPLVLNGSSRYAGQIRDLAKDIVQGDTEAPARKPGLVGRILSPFRSSGSDEARKAPDPTGSEVPAHG